MAPQRTAWRLLVVALVAACSPTAPKKDAPAPFDVVLPDATDAGFSVETPGPGPDPQPGECMQALIADAIKVPNAQAGSLTVRWIGGAFSAVYIRPGEDGVSDVELTRHGLDGAVSSGPTVVTAGLQTGRRAVGRVMVAGYPDGQGVVWMSNETIPAPGSGPDSAEGRHLFHVALDNAGGPLNQPERAHDLYAWLKCPDCPLLTGDACDPAEQPCHVIDSFNPQVDWVGDKFLVTFVLQADVFHYARYTFDPFGKPLDERPVLAQTQGPAVKDFAQAGLAEAAALLWSQTTFPEETFRLTYAVSSHGQAFTALNGQVVADDDDIKGHLAAATTGSGYLFGWSTIAGGDTYEGDRALHVSTLGPLGQIAGGPTALAETKNGSESPFGSLRVVGGEDGYVAVWSELTDAFGLKGTVKSVSATRVSTSAVAGDVVSYEPEGDWEARTLHEPAVLGDTVLIPVEVQGMSAAPTVHLLKLCL